MILVNCYGPRASSVTYPSDVCKLIRISHTVPCAESQRREYVTVQRLTRSNADSSMRQHHASHVLVQVRTNESCHTYDVNESCHLCTIDESCHMYALDSTYEYNYNDVNMYTYTYLICASASCVACKSVNESCQTGAKNFQLAPTYTYLICASASRVACPRAKVWMSHVTRVIWMSHTNAMIKSCLTLDMYDPCHTFGTNSTLITIHTIM